MKTLTVAFSSQLAPVFARYLDLKRALGRQYNSEARTLELLDEFLRDHAAIHPDLNAAAFQDWCRTHEHIASGTRRYRMLVVYNFCLYRQRTEPRCFVPNPMWFPKAHQRLRPYIFSEREVVRLLRAAGKLRRTRHSPLRPEMIRLAIVLLFTTGMRRGELLRLTVGDYDRQKLTLQIRETKFYKSRLLPLNRDIAGEVDSYLHARIQRKLPVSSDTAFMWTARWGGRGYHATGLLRCFQGLLQRCAILTPKGRAPRIHDARHSFAVNALLRWYREGADVDAKLPLLATYMGHASPLFTHHYLHWIEPLRTAASERFARHYGKLVASILRPKGGQR
jgi:integrase/recombinase XerD